MTYLLTCYKLLLQGFVTQPCTKNRQQCFQWIETVNIPVSICSVYLSVNCVMKFLHSGYASYILKHLYLVGPFI